MIASGGPVPRAARVSPSPPPRPLSSFIGRGREIEELGRALDGARLVTLTGAGGCGKTRLAIAVAGERGPGSPDGVAFADLGSTTACAGVAEVVAGAVDATARVPVDPAALVGEACLLLVVDGAERVLEGVVPVVEDLLVRCPNLRLLVTSREPLDLSGEVLWRVPPLTLPPEDVPPNPDDLDEFDSIRLFTARAREHHPSFELTRENAATVVEICRRLEGMPLALELAAARVGMLGLDEIGGRLGDGLRLLARGPRNAVARQRTLRAAIDWSHDLLDDAERAVFRQLAVFSGSFDLAAAEAVCAGPELARGEVMEVLERLVDKSLVTPHTLADGGLRYRLMEVVRQYARERLAEAGEAAVRIRHACCCAELAARVAHACDPAEGTGLALGVEYDDLRSALDWAEAHDPELQVSLVLSLSVLWDLRGSVREARRRTDAALAAAGRGADRQAWLLGWACYWARLSGDLEALDARAEEALALLPRLEDGELAIIVLSVHAFVCVRRGDLAAADEDLGRALELERRQPPTTRPAATLNNLGLALIAAGRAVDGLRAVDRALAMTGQPWAGQFHTAQLRARILRTRGIGLLALHQAPEAWECFLQMLEFAAAQANHALAVPALTGLAAAAAEASQPELCLELLGAAGRSARSAGTTSAELAEPQTAAAEQASRAAVGPVAAAAAWDRGAQLDLQAALERARGWNGGRQDTIPLSNRKLEVVRLVAAGLSNKEIARRLSISGRTVEGHLDQLRNQLGFRNRAQLAVWAASRSLLQ